MHSISISLNDIKTEQDRRRLLSIAIYAHDVATEYAKQHDKSFHSSDFATNKVKCHDAIAWYNVYIRISNFVNGFKQKFCYHPSKLPKNEN